MSRDEPPGSLADQAAAWVPPWARPPTDVEPAEAVAPDEPLEPDEPLPPPEPPEPLDPPEPLEPAEPLPPPELAEPPEPLFSIAAGPVAADPVAADPVATGGGSEPVARLAVLPDEELRAALEAILLVVDEPVSEIMLAQVVEQPTERVAAAVAGLAAWYTETGRGFELRAVAGGWRYYTRPEHAAYVERFVLDGQQVRLTQAALETLAVVAYKQPVTRSRISAIRGVNCDGVVRTLLSRGLVEECGSEPDSGAHLYRTTTLFLEKLGLNSVDQLPPLAPFLPDDVEAIADAANGN